MKKIATITATIAIALTFTACGSSGGESPVSEDKTHAEAQSDAPEAEPVKTETSADSPGEVSPDSAAAIADLLAASLADAEIVQITEDNDPNELLGRPNGYTDAAIIKLPGYDCADLGASCGITIEIWATEEDATSRSEYIQGVLKEMPMLGSEYNYINKNALLRISGEMKPSQAEELASIFNN